MRRVGLWSEVSAAAIRYAERKMGYKRWASDQHQNQMLRHLTQFAYRAVETDRRRGRKAKP